MIKTVGNVSVRSRVTCFAAALALGSAGLSPASAHHSFSSYDMSKTLSVSGTIKEIRWGAPHSSLVLAYVGPGGGPAAMPIISGSPFAFSRQGLGPRDFHRGDKVKITYHPSASGAPGGALASLTTASGRTFSDAEAASAATAN